jgi:hypothetical protein
MGFSTKVITYLLLATLTGWMILSASCRKDDEGGKLIFSFEHRVGEDMLVKDSLEYVNAAGNHYEVNELQYFISDIALWQDGAKIILAADSGVHYVDIDIPSTFSWFPDQVLPAGEYDSISFMIGLSEVRNVSGYFVNPPERDMFWPEVMGGGYHYLKMNGKWRTPQGDINPFNLHLGVGMISDSISNDIFIQNYLKITMPLYNCDIHDTQLSRTLTFSMDINSWFETPNNWDWNIIGGQIMQNQDAMHNAVENGLDAFTVSYLAENPKK